jgi:diguanylate cyclase (GGDEF)-like protein
MGRLQKGDEAGDALLHAALSSMPYGFSIWDDALRLVLWNQNYLDLYGFDPAQVRAGMSLHDIVTLTTSVGNHAGATADELYAIYSPRFDDHGDLARVRCYQNAIGGRVIKSTHIRRPHLWVVTHEDVTDEVELQRQAAARTRELEVQNVRFDAAISNMLHGLAMFDADGRLIVCNRQYADLYGLPDHLTRPGTSFWDMLEDGERTGMVSIADRDIRLKVLSAVIEAGRVLKDNLVMANGRVVAVLHQPMVGGGWISTHEDITEQHRHQETIQHLARHDALTDLPNRVLFREEMAKIEARSRRREITGVLMMDLDHFKAVNDTLGHAVGDRVLVAVAQRLREASRETDVVARLGGDEFAILVGPLETPHHASRIAERIVRSMAAPIPVGDSEVVIGASIGIAMAPLDGTDAETLLRNADLALYRAKAEGRGTYHFFEKGMDDAMRERRALELELRGALAAGQLRLVFQPVFNLAASRICGLEALLRWDHPARGVVPPAEFVPAAEDTGLIVPIGEWALRAACRAAAGWPETVRVSVNLSPVQFRHRGLVESVERALDEAGLAPSRLELEITEALLLCDGEAALATLHRLRAMGVRIAVDDFGSGFSSLRYLRSFPFDKIKIDRTFLGSLIGAAESAAMVTAMIGLGRNLGLSTTAEGIETEAQLEMVRSEGCEEVQGFLFSPPLPASGIDALFGRLAATDQAGPLRTGLAG